MSALMNFDIWVMLAVALACLPVFMTGRECARWEGGVFIVYYGAYVIYLFYGPAARTLGYVFCRHDEFRWCPLRSSP